MPAPFFDLQVNGFAGVDFQRDDLTADALEHATRELHAHRTGRILLTLISDTVDRLCTRLERIGRLREQAELARQTIVGYHIEGPWLSPEPGYHGAHDPAVMTTPTTDDFERLWNASSGLLRLITLAPEWPGSPEVIALAAQRGVRIAIGHSNASASQIDAAIAAGATLCTHLGNAVPMQLHRHDNIVQRLLARDELTAVFIPDGIHLPPFTLRNFVRAKPANKVLFTTDCMAAAGAPAGRYSLGVHELEVGDDHVVREPGKQSFAGSALAMDQAEANVRAFLHWPPEQARAACADAVATALGF